MLKLNKLLLALITLEIVFGGGGRMLDPLGVPPMRYVLFFLSIIVFVLNVITLRAKVSYFQLMLIGSFVFLPVYGTLVGAVRLNETNLLIDDLQPFLYCLIFLFVCMNDKEIINWGIDFFIKVVTSFSLMASSIYILYVALLKSGFIDFDSFYSIASESSEIFFRPSGAFFMKSFFFMAMGAVVFFCDKKFMKFLVVMAAIALTETRGVFLFGCAAIFIASLRINKIYVNLILMAIAFFGFMSLMSIVGDRAGDSDSARINDFYYVIKNLTDLSTIFGYGFGSEIAGRSRIEVVPLEMLYKTGFLGIMVSLLPILITSLKLWVETKDRTSLVILCFVVFSVGVSITNPFIYTPMGIFVMAIAINHISINRAKMV